MELYPAIDIKGGRVARYVGGGPETVYAPDPVALAEQFVAGGARWLHVVDLDRAFDTGENDALVRRLAAIRGARVQLGGLLAGPEQVARGLQLGAARAVVATSVLADARALGAIGAAADLTRLGIALDVRQARLVRRGSLDPLGLSPEEGARRAVELGIGVVLYRDLERDGGLEGPDLAGASRVTGLGADVIVAGGIATVAHLQAARAAGLAGAVVGRALHEGHLTLGGALACLR